MKMQLSTCNIVAVRVPQGNYRNERSIQLVEGSRLLISQGARVETSTLYNTEQWLRNLNPSASCLSLEARMCSSYERNENDKE